MNESKKNSKKKGGFPWALLILLIPFLRSLTEDELPPAVFAIAVAVIVFFILLGLGLSKKTSAAGRTEAARPAPAPKANSVELNRPVPAMPRQSAHRDFPKPDAPCVVCENTGEDHFARDRQRRIAQLDNWLKIGLIDKAEYQVLRRRYENDQ